MQASEKLIIMYIYEYFKKKIRYSLYHLWVCISFYHHLTFGINWPPRFSSTTRLSPSNRLTDSLEKRSIDDYFAFQNYSDRTFATALC